MMDRQQINEEELQVLYSSIGEGIWLLQYLEDALHTYITIKRDIKVRGSVPQKKAEGILLNHRGNTLGKSLKIAHEAEVFSPELQQRLDIFKEERDWLVHRSVYQNRRDLYVKDKRCALFLRIKEFSEEASVLQQLIGKELEKFGVSQGITRDQIVRLAEGNIKKLKGETL